MRHMQSVLCPLEIRLLGAWQVQVQGQPLPRLPSRKGSHLLALLTLRNGHPIDRDLLAGTLWTESTERQALFNLRQCLSNLRHALGGQAHRLNSPTPRTLCLDMAGAYVDVLEFDAAIASDEVTSWQQAVRLYRGPLLEGCLEEWVFPERQQREQAYLLALERLAQHFLAQGQPAFAAEYLRRAIRIDPLRESVQRALMQALAAAGDYNAALLGYRELRHLLHREMHAEPDAMTQALFQQIRQQAQHPSKTLAVPVPERKMASALADNARFKAVRVPCPIKAYPLDRPEPAGGAVPLGSAYYIERPVDQEFMQAIACQDSIVLVKGARQMGKTSLLARGLKLAREQGARVVYTDYQTFNAPQLTSADAFLQTLASTLAGKLDLNISPRDSWDPGLSANMNMDWFMESQVLKHIPEPLVWGMDEVDRLFSCDFGSEVFGLFRSWYNRRATEPEGPWSRLTLALAYATEAHLFISDLTQSPFNVGTRLMLEDFTIEQVAELNRRYGGPLKEAEELSNFYALVGGHPDLVRKGLEALASHRLTLEALIMSASHEGGPFQYHLRRLLELLSHDATLSRSVREILQGQPCPNSESFYHLRAAGVLVGDSVHQARPRCQLYATYLGQRLL